MKHFICLCCLLAAFIAAPVSRAADWFVDFEKAKAEAEKTKRPIFMLFTCSDGSAACISMDRAIFNAKKFRDYADNNLVLMKVDFPAAANVQSKETAAQNKELKAKFGVSAYPTGILVDSNGELYIDFIKHEGSIEKFRRKLIEIMDFDPPKRYAEYVDSFRKSYKPPKPLPKPAAEPKKTDKPRPEPANKPAPVKPAPALPDKPKAPIADAPPLIPINPDGSLEEWLRIHRDDLPSAKSDAPKPPAGTNGKKPAPPAPQPKR